MLNEITKYYSVEVINTSFSNDYKPEYPPRLTEWGMVACTPYEVYFIQTSTWGYAKVTHIFRLDEAADYVRIVCSIPPDADNLKLFCRYYGDLFTSNAGQLEKDFYQLFKNIL